MKCSTVPKVTGSGVEGDPRPGGYKRLDRAGPYQRPSSRSGEGPIRAAQATASPAVYQRVHLFGGRHCSPSTNRTRRGALHRPTSSKQPDRPVPSDGSPTGRENLAVLSNSSVGPESAGQLYGLQQRGPDPGASAGLHLYL